MCINADVLFENHHFVALLLHIEVNSVAGYEPRHRRANSKWKQTVFTKPNDFVFA